MKKLLLVLCSIPMFIGFCSAQDIQELFKEFDTPREWKAELHVTDSFPSFYQGRQVGLLSFTYEEQKVVFQIFQKEVEEDSVFLFEQQGLSNSTSCFPGPFGRITVSGYHFVPQVCSTCDPSKDKPCRKLVKAWKGFVWEWYLYNDK